MVLSVSLGQYSSHERPGGSGTTTAGTWDSSLSLSSSGLPLRAECTAHYLRQYSLICRGAYSHAEIGQQQLPGIPGDRAHVSKAVPRLSGDGQYDKYQACEASFSAQSRLASVLAVALTATLQTDAGIFEGHGILSQILRQAQSEARRRHKLTSKTMDSGLKPWSARKEEVRTALGPSRDGYRPSMPHFHPSLRVRGEWRTV